MPDILKVAFVFALLVVLLLRRLDLAAAMLGGSVLLGVLFQLDLQASFTVAFRTLSDRPTVELVLALSLIMIMEDIMRREGVLQRMVGSLGGLVADPRVVMATLPALVGLIPSAGGAMFSAPMVEEVSRDSDATGERKTFINYWYRHLWEFVLPIYPVLLLGAQVFDVPLSTLILVLVPVPLVTIVSGWRTAFHGLTLPVAGSAPSAVARHARDLALGVAPIAAVLLLVLASGLGTALSVALVLAALLVVYRYSPGKLFRAAREAVSVSTLLAVLSVLFFKDMLAATGAAESLAPALQAAHVPVAGVFIALPFAIGLLTGANVAYVGMSGPILVGLAGPAGVAPVMAAVALVSGFIGVMLSPAHLCLALTTTYFQAKPIGVYRLLLVPEVGMLALVVAYLAVALQTSAI